MIQEVNQVTDQQIREAVLQAARKHKLSMRAFKGRYSQADGILWDDVTIKLYGVPPHSKDILDHVHDIADSMSTEDHPWIEVAAAWTDVVRPFFPVFREITRLQRALKITAKAVLHRRKAS